MAPDALSARRARHFLIQALHTLGGEELAEIAALLVTELVTNAVVHARTEVTLRIQRHEAVVRFEVHDGSPRSLAPRPADTGAADGRGLQLVDKLADAWGSDTDPAGKTVWFELAA